MAKLHSVACPGCGRQLYSDEFIPSPKGGAPAATSYHACLRRCSTCGLGLSNSRVNPVAIYHQPCDNIPVEVHEGFLETLSSGINEKNRANKLAKAGFETSEDAVTWTVFRYLQQAELLPAVFGHLLRTPPSLKLKEPSLLLWGVPVPGNNLRGIGVRQRLLEVSDGIPEKSFARSEPDVIMDFGDDGLIVVEVKHRSGNEVKPNYPPFDTYLRRPDAFRDADALRQSGYYELTRNWRIGHDLAGSRAFTLINLGPVTLFHTEIGGLRKFRQGLREGSCRQFLTVAWSTLLDGIPGPLLEWFRKYLSDRGLTP